MRKNFSLSPEQRADARDALKILEGTELSLCAAARIATGRLGAAQKTLLEDAIDRFLRDCMERNLRRRTVEFYESKLNIFSLSFPDRCLDDFVRPELKEWIKYSAQSATTAAGYLRAIRALFRWCRKQDPPLCFSDPTEGLELPKAKKEREVQIFNPHQAEAIVRTAEQYQAAAVLMLFAGVRPSEINAREKPALLWQHVDFDEHTIRIPADIAKTRATRILEGLPDNLWSWLEALKEKPSHPICKPQTKYLPRHVKDSIGVWIQDGCRHSFATYHLAKCGDVNKTSLILGHEGRTSLLYNTYRGLCTKKEGEAFFSIVP